jgi:hypothetical protein
LDEKIRRKIVTFDFIFLNTSFQLDALKPVVEEFHAIVERNRRRLPLWRGSVSRGGQSLRDNPLPLSDLPARQRCAFGDMGGIRF